MNHSHLEAGFALTLKAVCHGLPAPVLEHRFSPPRRWRFDLAFPEKLLAIEIEGGIWVKGRHSRPKGLTADCDKYNAATLQGWRILRFTTEHLKKKPVQCAELVQEAYRQNLYHF